jgi:hypothetical protein
VRLDVDENYGLKTELSEDMAGKTALNKKKKLGYKTSINGTLKCQKNNQ